MKTLGFIILLFASVSAVAQHTYYISQSSGSDSNTSTQAQLKSTPWQNLPGSRTSAPTYTPVAGDTFILKGCDIWPNSTFPILWSWSGTSGSKITITVDQTWYNTSNCASAWNRPVFNAGAAIMGGVGECSGGIHNIFVTDSGSYNIWAWIEATGLYWAGTCNGTGVFNETSTAGGVTVDHWYIHNWTTNMATSTDMQGFIYIPGSGPCNSNAGATNCTVQYTVFDNGDSSQVGTGKQSGGGVQSWNVINSIFNHMTNALKPYTNGEFGGNFITNIGGEYDGVTHLNCIESIAATGNQTYYIHDNVISGNSSCEGLQVGNPGETDYVWNNIWNSSGGGNNGPQSPQQETPVGMYFWNNTVGGGWGQCIKNAGHGSSYGTYFYIQNNHCINSGSAITDGSFTATNLLISDNVGMTQATATGQGYTTTETFLWQPASGCTVGTCSTLQVGTSGPPSYAPTGTSPSGGTFNTNDTTYACTEGSIAGVVQPICPARTTKTRPGSAAWDAGAYEFSAGAITPNPPVLFYMWGF